MSMPARIDDIKMHHLTYFVQVATSGSLVKAVEVLGVTQPAVSVAIGDLEKILGVPLFRRRPTGMELTGARKCSLGPTPVAYLFARDGDARVSIYIMKRLPEHEGRMLRETRGKYSLLVHDDGERIICAVGACPPESLERLTR